MDLLITLIVVAALAGAVLWGMRTFLPELDRARRIRRAERNSELKR